MHPCKYTYGPIYLDDNGDYCQDLYKWEEAVSGQFISLGPELPEQFPPERSYVVTDRLLDRTDSLQAHIETESSSSILWISRWDSDCYDHISIYRTSRFLKFKNRSYSYTHNRTQRFWEFKNYTHLVH